ncbi:MAG: NUDIX hydrolase [Acidobacteria bacterium]|nr:NUDIX hydrolase [Acidobacteriota bacterium]
MTKAKDHAEKLGASEILYSGRVFSLERHRVREPNGLLATRDIIHHPGSSVILPVLPDGNVVLIRQYRIAINCEIWELPAGTRDPKETFLQTAKRELTEETGYRARRWKKLVEYFPSPGFLNERMAIYLADQLVPGQATPEDDEQITVHRFSFERALQMIRTGQICDSKTLIGLLYWKQFVVAQTQPKSNRKIK